MAQISDPTRRLINLGGDEITRRQSFRMVEHDLMQPGSGMRRQTIDGTAYLSRRGSSSHDKNDAVVARREDVIWVHVIQKKRTRYLRVHGLLRPRGQARGHRGRRAAAPPGAQLRDPACHLRLERTDRSDATSRARLRGRSPPRRARCSAYGAAPGPTGYGRATRGRSRYGGYGRRSPLRAITRS